MEKPNSETDRMYHVDTYVHWSGMGDVQGWMYNA